MAILEIINEAKNKKAELIEFSIGQIPKMKKSFRWSPLRERQGLPSEWREWQDLLLSESMRSKLQSNSFLMGEARIDSQPIVFRFSQTEKLNRLQIEFLEQVETFDRRSIPELWYETVQRLRGLNLVIANDLNLRLGTCVAALNRILPQRFLAIAIITDDWFPLFDDHGSTIIRLKTAEVKKEILKNVDLVIIDNAIEESMMMAIELAEQGYAVWYCGTGFSVSNTLRKSFGFLKSFGSGHAAFRFSEVVQSFLVQTQVIGLESDRVVAIEFLPIKTQIRGFMMKEDFASIDHILSGLVENSGLVTL
ncbi:MAG TPA: hypothetical protein PLU50_03385, partial [Pseudobdellovibrionaceae bacterium]|nr:hypothetical protein [Pseudobdellovibrionaceae bacterium]